MVAVLADPSLYRYIGGTPPDPVTLAERYAVQVKGRSPNGAQRWLNWIVRRCESRDAIGYVQATIAVETGETDVAWVIGAPYQQRGYATEAARAMLDWLATLGEERRITAHIAPENAASRTVAERLGFAATPASAHGETVWELQSRR
jgi:RimJ/RimL family protein N-acetyltransferase